MEETVPFVSVIIPTYNRREYVQEAVDSVLAQTYTDYEIIVVDDGSTDETGEALQERYGERVRYLWQENAGGSVARNRGWLDAAASHVLFLDSDDVLLPDALEELCTGAAEQPEVGVIGGGWEYINGDGRVLGGVLRWRAGDDLGLARWLFSCPFIPSAALVRSDWFQTVGGFDPGQEAAQDWDLWLRMAAAGCPMLQVPDVVCRYRLHGEALTADLERQLRGHLRALDKLFARDDVPDDFLDLRGTAYARVYTVAAARGYGVGRIEEAHRHLKVAVSLAPELVRSNALIEDLLEMGRSPIVASDPNSYMEVVLANILPELSRGRRIARARARLAAGDLFGEYARNADRRRLRRLWWNVVCHDATWLLNLGVWSIGAEAFLGQRIAGRLRAMARWWHHGMRLLWAK